MALPTQNINISLRPVNQQAATTQGPVGRCDRINNGIAKKFLRAGQGPQLRVEKRPAFNLLTTAIDVNDGGGNLAGAPKWLADYRGQLVGLFGAQPYVYSEKDAKWIGRQATGGYATVASQTLTKRAVFNLNTHASSPDSACVNDVIMYVFRSSTAAVETQYMAIQDSNGVTMMTPRTTTITNAFRIKVVSDGAHFWVFSQAVAMTSTTIQVFDTSGTQLATTSIAWGAARDKWDVRYAANLAQIVLATPLAATTDMRFMTYAAGVITTVTATTPAADCRKGVAFLDNTAGTNIYISGCDNAFGVNGFEISSAGALTATFAVDPANTDTVQNITGYVQFGAATPAYMVVAYAVQAAAASYSARNNLTRVINAARGGGTSLVTQRSLSLASRAWHDVDGNYLAVAYYQSTAVWTNTANVDISTIDMQPSYFVMSLGILAESVVGQFEFGSASFSSGAPQSVDYNPWHLSSAPADSDENLHIALGYFGEQAVSSVIVPVIGPTTALTNFSGINDYIMSPTAGRPTDTTDELLIPGLQATRFDGNVFVEDGIALAPEVMNFTVSAGGSLTNNEPYVWAGVYEWLDNNGNVVESIPSTTYTATPTGGANLTANISFTTLRATTKQNVRISVYRTFSPTLTGTTPGIELRKVGEVLNNPAADSVTFVDGNADTIVAVGQPMYTQPLILSAPQPLDYFPAPAFSRGIAFDGRTFVIGYDNAIWFSLQRVDGHGSPFNPALRIILPTTARALNIVPMDARLVILCADGTVWTVPSGNLPNATITSGSIPQPEQLPFTVGTTGAALMLPVGAIFAAEVGAWLMDRSLSAEFIGSPVIDELTDSDNLTVLDICVDREQRVYFTVGIAGEGGTSTRILVYDLIVAAWYTWDAPIGPVVAASWKGRYVFADPDSQVWLLDKDGATTYTDNGAGIITTVALSSNAFAGTNGFQRLWGTEFFGQFKDSHLIKVSYTYDNATTPAEVWTQPVGVDPGIYRWEVRQEEQKMAAVAVTFQDDFTWPTIATLMSHTP